MFHVGRLVGRINTLLIQRGTEHLNTFEDHFHHVLIAVIPGAGLNFVVENKNIHRCISSLGIWLPSFSLPV